MIQYLALADVLAEREAAGLTRQRKTLNSAQTCQVEIEGKSYLNFSSNDYLGLANSEQSVKAATQAGEVYGFGAGASHLVAGHQAPHQRLESAMADFLSRDAALGFASGYMANLAILQSLAKKGDLIIADKLNHASLIDGVQLSNAESRRYPHCDLGALERRLSRASQNRFVVTDSVFSMDGDIAPLNEISGLCEKYRAVLIVDDAHGFGVLGQRGSGCAEHFGLNQKQLPVMMTTLGKALGGYGAVVSGEKILVNFLLQTARTYIYTTAMPAMVAAGNLANLELLKQDPSLVEKLRENIHYFRHQSKSELSKFQQINLLDSKTAIQPIVVGENANLLAINRLLETAGILVGAIRPPTVPVGTARLRITLSASHSKKDIDRLIAAIKAALNQVLV